MDDFTVSLTSDVTLSINDRFPFDQVLSNPGGAYSTQQHQFVCPKSGYYQFSISVLAQTDSDGSDTYIMLGDAIIAGMEAHNLSGCGFHYK